MIKSNDGHTEIFDNGGAGYLIEDQIILQVPQSCVDAGGALTVVAAVSYFPRKPLVLPLNSQWRAFQG